MLCNYIRHKLKVSMKDAIKLFEAARLHKLEYDFTLDMLLISDSSLEVFVYNKDILHP